jgi:hypothetical protein
VTTTVRTTALEVWITPPPTDEVPDPEAVLDDRAYAVSCSFGFDQRVAEATIRRTGGGTVEISYWYAVEIRMGCTPGHGLATRFKGYVVPVDNSLYPIDSVLTCKGTLYRAAFVKNTVEGGTPMVDPGTGTADETMVQEVLTSCGVPFDPAHIGGTGKALGSLYIALDDPVTPGPFTWAEGSAGLDFLEALDAVSVPDTPGSGVPVGRYRTFESLNGEIHRIPLATVPAADPDFSFEEGVDVLEARITRDPVGAANRVVVSGAPMPLPTGVAPPPEVRLNYVAFFAVSSAFAPYLPPDLPDGPDGYPAVTASFSSPMIEKGATTDPDYPEDVLSCQAVADFLLAEYNCVLDTLEFSTPRDDLLGPGQTVHLTSARLGLTDPDRHYWVQRLEVTMDERGAFTQRLTCLRRS